MDRSDMMHRMYDIKGPLVAKKFAARGFEAVYCPTKEEALKQDVKNIRGYTFLLQNPHRG